MKTKKRFLRFLIGVLGFSSMMVSCNKEDGDGDIRMMYGVAPAEYKENIHQIDPAATEQTLTVNDEEQSH